MELPATKGDLHELRQDLRQQASNTRDDYNRLADSVVKLGDRMEARAKKHEEEDEVRFRPLEDLHAKIGIIGLLALLVLTPLTAAVVAWIFKHW